MIYVLNGDPIFDDVVQTGETVSLDLDLEIPIDPARVPNVLGVAGNSNNPNRIQLPPITHMVCYDVFS